MKLYMPDGQIKDNFEAPDGVVIYPGSFNPLHDGHRAIADTLIDDGHYVYFEISQTRYQKEAYTDEEVAERVKQFAWKYPVVVTQNAPLFFDKYEIFKNAKPRFVMGADTLKRWLDMTNPEDVPDDLRLIVFGRLTNGEYHDPRKMWDENGPFGKIDIQFYDMEMDISSTEIRNGMPK